MGLATAVYHIVVIHESVDIFFKDADTFHQVLLEAGLHTEKLILNGHLEGKKNVLSTGNSEFYRANIIP